MAHQHCGVLLAGGRGTRFGGAAKGLLPFGAGRLADGALHALSACCSDVVIAANDAQAETWFPGLRIARDDGPALGALGALATALRAGNGRSVVVCAWDMPFVTAALLEALAQVVEEGATCCVPVHADGRAEPLCAAYGPTCSSLVIALLERGERAGHALLQFAGGVAWPIAEAPASLVSPHTFVNVNTPDELSQAAAWAAAVHA